MVSGSFEIRLLGPDDAEALVLLRREALAGHPLAFGASPEDDRSLSPELVRTSLADPQASAVFGLFTGAEMVGMVGVVRATGLKRRHKAHVWGMYVSTRARGRGAGRSLLEAAIGQARSWPGVEQLQLSVTEAADEARRLYAAAGFREWGRESRSLRWEGEYVDEIHLVLDL